MSFSCIDFVISYMKSYAAVFLWDRNIIGMLNWYLRVCLFGDMVFRLKPSCIHQNVHIRNSHWVNELLNVCLTCSLKQIHMIDLTESCFQIFGVIFHLENQRSLWWCPFHIWIEPRSTKYKSSLKITNETEDCDEHEQLYDHLEQIKNNVQSEKVRRVFVVSVCFALNSNVLRAPVQTMMTGQMLHVLFKPKHLFVPCRQI